MPLPAGYVNMRGMAIRGVQRLMSAIYAQTWTDATAASTNDILTALAGPNTATLTLTPNSGLNGSLVAGPTGGKYIVLPYPRNIVITVTHASAVVAESGVISGFDVYGRDISEAWSVTAGTVSKTFTGKKAFKRITQITIIAASDASANTNIVGDGVVFGLDVNCSVGGAGAAVKELSGGAIVTTGTLVAASAAATDDPRGTYAPSAAPDGARDYTVWFISDNPEASA